MLQGIAQREGVILNLGEYLRYIQGWPEKISFICSGTTIRKTQLIIELPILRLLDLRDDVSYTIKIVTPNVPSQLVPKRITF